MPVELEKFYDYPTEVEIDGVVRSIIKFLEAVKEIPTDDIVGSRGVTAVPMAYTSEELSLRVSKSSNNKERSLFEYALEVSLKRGIDRRYVNGK